jgi:transposase
LVEQSVRPLKIGAKNWGQIGHPNAGPRMARLFTLIENCRQEGIDPEAYLVDIIARLPDHPMKRIAELLPRAWKAARPIAPSTAVVVA